jgi:hypothetical protein
MTFLCTTKSARIGIASAVAVFLPLVGASMLFYPGGTSWDTSTVGHDFWLNYLCDLLRPTALDGVANPVGSALAKAATLILGAGLLPFFWLVPRHFPAMPRLGRAVAWLGSLSVAAVPAVVFISGDRYGVLHGISVCVAAAPGLAAACLAVVGLAWGEARPKRVALVGGLTLTVSAIDFALYVPQVLTDASGPVAVAILERVSLGMVLVWMLVVAARTRGRANRLA